MSTDHAFVGLLEVDLHFPQVASLKGKRAELNRIKAWVHGRAGGAVAEVDHQDTWQRSTLAVVLVGGSQRRVEESADAVERMLGRWEPRIERRVLSWADTEAIG